MGKPVTYLSSEEGYRLWAATYDRDPNPLLALEERLAGPLLGRLAGLRVVDLCAGTGRWMAIAASLKADVTGIDLSGEMLRQAGRRPGLSGRVALGNLIRLPVACGSADLAICSFGISYVPSLGLAFREMARVARRVLVSDMHPLALLEGWTRSFETASAKCCLNHCRWSLEDIDRAADDAGLRKEHTVEGCFGEPERRLFNSAGKPQTVEKTSRIPAVYVKTWLAP